MAVESMSRLAGGTFSFGCISGARWLKERGIGTGGRRLRWVMPGEEGREEEREEGRKKGEREEERKKKREQERETRNES